jgi:hydroxyacylglutathione hydrolase
MKRINRVGPKVLGGFPEPPKVGVQAIEKALAAGATIIDTRTADEYAKGHITGTINIPLTKSFTNWAGWLVRYDVEIHLITIGAEATRRAVRGLAMIGLDHVVASHGMEVVQEWRHKGNELGTIARTDAKAVAPRVKKGEVTVLDVRNDSEFAAGHVPGAVHIPLGHLQERLKEVPRDKPIVVHCQAGGRSAIASSVLAKAGVTDFEDLRGGWTEWVAGGNKVER